MGKLIYNGKEIKDFYSAISYVRASTSHSILLSPVQIDNRNP
jgi:hypothetical protein